MGRCSPDLSGGNRGDSDTGAMVTGGGGGLGNGGRGQVFAQTTNPAASTGDGVACAWRAGAVLRDLEFFQFHPTALKLPEAPRFLISEAVRGEGAHLVDQHQYRFAFESHPQGELAPRDVVSRAIYRHLQAHPTPSEAVYLDLRVIPPAQVKSAFLTLFTSVNSGASIPSRCRFRSLRRPTTGWGG